MGVGFTYRLKLSGMPDFPGRTLYPTIELIDKLHPPAGLENDFPIPVSFAQDEIEEALAGRLVTKVVYLEQPQLAPPSEMRTESNTYSLPDKINLIAEADRRGRPMAIIRIGSRTPPTHGTDFGFYGEGGPLHPSFARSLPFRSTARPAVRSGVRQVSATPFRRVGKTSSAAVRRLR